MSENGEEEEQVKIVPEEPGKKFFISHVNSYTGRTLFKELNNKGQTREEFAEHSFQGTLETGTNHIYTM